MAQSQKFSDGEEARGAWAKPLRPEEVSGEEYNKACGDKFKHMGNIVLDTSSRRQTTIDVVFISDSQKSQWIKISENIYMITRNGKVMKIGGTRTGMAARWISYKCGHCVPQRMKKSGTPFPGKMSVTNAHLYHTIEKDLLSEEPGNWSFWSWTLPETLVEVVILGEPTTVVAQTYHAYESKCIRKFTEVAGHIPQLCNNSDPSYR